MGVYSQGLGEGGIRVEPSPALGLGEGEGAMRGLDWCCSVSFSMRGALLLRARGCSCGAAHDRYPSALLPSFPLASPPLSNSSPSRSPARTQQAVPNTPNHVRLLLIPSRPLVRPIPLSIPPHRPPIPHQPIHPLLNLPLRPSFDPHHHPQLVLANLHLDLVPKEGDLAPCGGGDVVRTEVVERL